MKASIVSVFAVLFITVSTVRSEDLTPGTTLWLTQRMSVTTKTGVIGFSPGSRMTVIKDNGPTITVTDGTHSFEASRAQLTTDPAVAQSAATGDYASQVALANAQQKQIAEMNQAAATEAKGQAVIGEEKAAAAKSKRIIGHVRYQEDGGLIVECDQPYYGRVVTSSLGRIGGGGNVYAGPEPQQSEVEGTIWLTGHPKQREIADGDSINVRAYEAGIHQAADGSRVRQYKVLEANRAVHNGRTND
jgi:hypothetical protein